MSFIFINLLKFGINGTGYAAFLTFSFRLTMLLLLTLREKDLQETNILPDYRIFLGIIDYVKIGRAVTWFDLGSFENIYQCSEFVRLIEKRQGQKISDI